MICAPCADGAHDVCKGKSRCDCQHRGPWVTKTGRVLTENDCEQLARESEATDHELVVQDREDERST